MAVWRYNVMASWRLDAIRAAGRVAFGVGRPVAGRRQPRRFQPQPVEGDRDRRRIQRAAGEPLGPVMADRAARLHEGRAAAEPLNRRAAEALRRLALAAADNKAGDRLPPAARYADTVAATAAALESEPIRRRLAGHAYTQTALLRLLEDARQGGVSPPALFSWLKGVDRPLWYALSSLGRRAPFVEALGATSHFEAERRAGGALYPPAVEAAVEGLRREAARVPPAGDKS